MPATEIPTSAEPAARRGRGPLGAAWAIVVAFFVWTAGSDNVSWRFGEEQADYYNLLVDGFLDGQLSLKAEVPRELLESRNPYDPAQRPAGVGLHDASLYQGKYYIYYGVVPAVLVLLPFRLVAGVDLPIDAAVLALVVGGFSFALALLAGLRREYFPRRSAWTVAGLGVVLGACGCTAILVRRSTMYELPIASGFCAAMAALFFLWRALGRGTRRPAAWLALSSAAWGLAIGSRPTYLLAPLGLLWAAAAIERARGRVRGSAIFAAAAPLAGIGLMLAWYNYARFGHPAEFGVKYILSSVYEAEIEHFRPRYAWWNLNAYFAAGSEWSGTFPFFRGAEIGVPRPAQHFGMDIPFGLLWHVPFLALAGAVPWTARRVRLAAQARAGGSWMLGAMGSAAAAPLAVLLMFYAAMVRYLADFAPALALLACVGAMEVIERRRRVATLGVAALAVFSTGVVLVFSVRVYDRVRNFNPAAYERIESFANAPARWLGLAPTQSTTEERPARSAVAAARLKPNLHDGVRLRIAFPEGAPGRREPLLASGAAGRANVLAVEYLGAGRLRLVFEHWGRAPYFGPVLSYESGRDTELVVRHPLYAATGSRDVPVGKDPLVVELNGQRIWSVAPLFYPARAEEVFLGAQPMGFGGIAERFGGTISLNP